MSAISTKHIGTITQIFFLRVYLCSSSKCISERLFKARKVLLQGGYEIIFQQCSTEEPDLVTTRHKSVELSDPFGMLVPFLAP